MLKMLKSESRETARTHVNLREGLRERAATTLSSMARTLPCTMLLFKP